MIEIENDGTENGFCLCEHPSWQRRMMNSTLPTLILFLLTNAGVCDPLCESPQYLERGKTGIVNCQFPDSYYGIFWYDAGAVSRSDPIVYLKTPSERGGSGYESNEYNIAANGSLVITEVSMEDDKNFTAVVLKSERELASENYITVIVTVKPYQVQPHIDGCNAKEQVCFKIVNDTSELSCNVTDARPSVDLNWYIRTMTEDNLLNSRKSVTLNNSLYTTLVQTTYIPDNYENVVYICKSQSYPSLLKNEYSLVLVQNQNFEKFEIIEPTPIYARQFANITLPCTDQPTLFLLWKTTDPTNRTENLIHMLSTDNARFITNINSDKYTVTNQSSLGIGEVDVIDEGFYSCTFGDGISESVKKYNLQVVVLPDPIKPYVEGCTKAGLCSLTVPKTGELSCSLTGIRPKAELRWETVRNYQTKFITFSTVSLEIEENGFIYDITLRSKFRIEDSYSKWIYIRCRAFNFGDNSFNLSREVFLNQLNGEKEEVADPSGNGSDRWKPFMSIVAVLLLIAVGMAIGFVIFWVNKRRRPHKETDEEMAMIHQDKPSNEKINTFKEELKTNYLKSWEMVYPLPYDRHVSYQSSEIFIEGEIEHLEKAVDEKFYIWQKLESHNDCLSTSWKRQTDILLEGEPGFGKTTLGYQFAIDWATRNSQSPLKDIDFFILLRLRYLKDVSSIPSAIRQFLLPGHSSLTIEDVKNILYHSSSVVIFLDGYNRFTLDGNNDLPFMKDIRTNNICKNCQVIVTTKPFCLPDYLNKDIKRMRLTGFGEESWRKYLKKSVTGGDIAEEERIMSILHENSILRDLCQVPLFFVLFAHTTKTYGYFDRDFKTVTAFFQKLTDSFHRKIGTDVAVNGHEAVSSVCFDGLLNKEKGLIWEKECIRRELGETLYNSYRRVGLIVEKDFCRHHGRSERRNTGNVTYETKVRFFHDVFCEWYAAKKFAQVLKTASEEKVKKYFEKINPFDHQYVYRFACAIDDDSAKKIINYMQSVKYGEKFAILCILEQSSVFVNVENTIGNICSSPVTIAAYDNLFLQRSTVQLLEFASDKKITIECVWLGKTNSTFDDDRKALELASGICLPKLATLRQLSVHDPHRELSMEDLTGFFKYISLCDSLKDLRFRACLLPLVKLENVGNVRDIIGTKAVNVQWELPVHDRNWYTLDIQSGKWRYNDETMTEQKYNEVVQSFRSHSRPAL